MHFVVDCLAKNLLGARLRIKLVLQDVLSQLGHVLSSLEQILDISLKLSFVSGQHETLVATRVHIEIEAGVHDERFLLLLQELELKIGIFDSFLQQPGGLVDRQQGIVDFTVFWEEILNRLVTQLS